MLTLAAASACDVCSDAYGPTVMPHSIPCGHSFCRTCLTTISERAPKGPVCPLCRETFDTSSIRVIRVDLSDPLPPLTYDNTPFSDDTDSDISDRGRGSLYPSYEARIRDEARALELRVAKAASIKCTFEEVSALHKEIQDWLLSDPRHKPASKFAALRLSAALLRAILLNSVAFTDANRLAKEKIAGLESAKTTLEAEVRRQRQQYSEKVHECNALQAEVERLRRSPAPGYAPSVARSSPFPAPATPSPPPSSSTMPPPPTRTTPPNLASNLPSPLSAQSPTRNPPPRSVSTSPYSQGTPSAPSIHQRTQSMRSGQNSPTPAATAAAQQYLRNTQTSPTPPRTAVENLMYRSNPSALPRSMTAPPPPSPNTPPPIRTQTKPRVPLRSSHERWVPVIEETDVESSENHYTRARSNTIRAAPVRPIHA